MIRIAKLLSPSHASHSISLYSEYKLWLETNQIYLCNNFKGFISNRFGRIAELAKIFLTNQDYIKAFFQAVVDTNSNKFVLAAATFIQNEWFIEFSRIYVKIAKLIIFLLMDFLGIDRKTQQYEERSWTLAKVFFDHKLSLLKYIKSIVEEACPNGIES